MKRRQCGLPVRAVRDHQWGLSADESLETRAFSSVVEREQGRERGKKNERERGRERERERESEPSQASCVAGLWAVLTTVTTTGSVLTTGSWARLTPEPGRADESCRLTGCC